MNDEANKRTDRDVAAEAWLDVHLQEELGELQAPDLRHRVLASTAEQRAAAAMRANRPSRSMWLAAAVLLIGIATVLAVIQATQPATPNGTETNTPDPNVVAPDKQDPKDEELIVKTLTQFQKHLKTPTKMTMMAGLLSVPRAMLEPEKGHKLVLTPAQMRVVAQELQNLKPLQPAGWKWDNRIRIYLANGRYMTFAVYRTSEHRVGIRGLGDFRMTEKLRSLLAPLLEGVALKNRLAGGWVKGREDLLREGDISIPLDIENMRCSNLEDEDLLLLTRFTKLRDLDLSGSRKTLKGTTLDELLQLPLVKLSLRHVQLDEKHIGVLGKHPTLRLLNISNQPNVTGMCALELAQSKTLNSLHIRESASLTDAGIEAITGISSVRYLDLSYIKPFELTTSGICQLSTMQNLRSLKMTRVAVSMDELLSALGWLPKLTELDIRETNVTNVGIAAMAAKHAAKPGRPTLPLKILDMSLCKQLEEGVLAQLGNYLNLEHLILSRSAFRSIDTNGKSTKDDFADLLSLQKLKHLELNGTRIDATACKHIAQLPSLTHLDLSFTGSGITDEAVEFLGDAAKLEHLKLTGCDAFGDKGLMALVKLRKLKHLDLNVCDGITSDGVDAFRKARPDCELRVPSSMR